MALLNAPCGCGSGGTLVVLYEDGTAPPVSGNRVTLERPSTQEEWAGTAGPGVTITQPLSDDHLGHRPTIKVNTSPFSPVPLGFDAAGRLTVGPVDVAGLQTAVTVNGGTAVQGGISATTGGTKGHTVTLAVAPSTSDGSSRVFTGTDGGLAVDPPTPFVWDVINAAGNTRTIRLRNTLNDALISLGTA